MSALTSLSLTNVRCFEGTQQARLPRITVLVGDNSAGKSTFLGSLRALAKLTSFDDLNDENHFDEPPFGMGSFATIARSGAATFSLAATLQGHCYDRIRVVYDEGPNGEPRERELELGLAADRGEGPTFKVTRLDRSGNGDEEMWRTTGPNFEFAFQQSSVSYRQFTTWLSRSVRRGNLPHDGNPALLSKRTGDLTPQAVGMFAGFVNFFRQHDRFPPAEQRLSLATNDPVGWRRSRAFEANPFGRAVDDAAFEKIRELGRELGLFTDLDVRHGRGGEYEVWADASGEAYNLVDVGFGIQSVLPLLLTIASAPEEATLLLQQPEAHLHPQAQAALVRLIAARRNRLLVETHSDHVPDWFRIAVMSKQVDSRDLGIVYFHRSDDRASTVLHDIQVDEQANLGETPPYFRRFFLDETERLLGFRR